MSAKPRRKKGAPFNASIEVQFDGCCVWTGALTGQGYGNYWHPQKKINVPAHVFAWEEVNGPVPEGYELHHKCEVRPCVAFDHLELVTPQEHKELHAMAITHCPVGHEYTPENTYVRNDGNGKRQCRACHRKEMASRRKVSDS